MPTDSSIAKQPPDATPPVPEPLPAIHEAELEPGTSGRVLRGAEIDFDAAVARRRAGRNVAVRGEDPDANRRLANRIESAAGPTTKVIRTWQRFSSYTA